MRPMKLKSQILHRAGEIIKKLKYPAGIGIIIYLIYQIGWQNILHALQRCSMEAIIVSLLPAIIASVLRIKKLALLMERERGDPMVLDVFNSSRVGKELTFLGYFVPVLNKELRKANVFNILIVDRLLETLVTLAVGFIAALVAYSVFHQPLCLYFSLLLLGLSVALGAAIGLEFPLPFKNSIIVQQLRKFISGYQIVLKNKRRLSLKLLGLTVAATLLDFFWVGLIFYWLRVPVNFIFIPIAWAMSGIVVFVTFMPVGPGEYTVIHLYKILAGVDHMETAAMLIIGKIVITLNLLIFIAWRLLKSRQNRLTELTVMLTNRCNSKCLHCNIWRIPTAERHDISPDFVTKIPYKLRNLILTGGEPTLYKNIVNVILELAKKKPHRITITTNGINSRRLEEILEQIMKADQKVLKLLAVRFSLDGYGESNDRVRGIPGSMDKLMKSIAIARRYGITNIGVTQTCSEKNIDEIPLVYNFAKKHHLQYGFQVAHSSDFYHNDSNHINNIDLFKQNLNYILTRDIRFKDPRAWFRAYFHSFYISFVENKCPRPVAYPCLAGRDYLFVTNEGMVKPCLLMDTSYGNLFETRDGKNVLETVAGNTEVAAAVKQCKQKCWLICTANREIKRNPYRGIIWIMKSWLNLWTRKSIV